MKDDLLEIGKIVNTHGIRGEVKIQPWCDEPELFDELEYLFIEGENIILCVTVFIKHAKSFSWKM